VQFGRSYPSKSSPTTGDFFVVNIMSKENVKLKDIKCYRCNKKIPIPEDYTGNPYTLLEVHYVIEHEIDLKTFDWDNPKDMYGDDVILDKLKKLDDEQNNSESA